LTVLPSDVFLVSYPRSGNTWLRFLVANVLQPEEQATFPTITRLVPDIYDEPDRSLRRRPSPRVLKSHEPYDPRYGRVVYLVRHPADVAVSYYHYLIKMRTIGEGYDVQRFVEAFIAGRLDEFGTWGDHVARWLDARGGDAEFVFLRYEDLLADPERALRRVLGLLGRASGDDGVRTAIERSSADELRRLERATANELPTFRSSRPDKPFIRRATSGAGADELPAELVAEIVAAWSPVLVRTGYQAPG
jgi:Sulfotransferase domain